MDTVSVRERLRETTHDFLKTKVELPGGGTGIELHCRKCKLLVTSARVAGGKGVFAGEWWLCPRASEEKTGS